MFARWIIACCCLSLLAGCSGDGLTTVPVSGTVTLDGQAVAGAGVMFIPEGDGSPATGMTDAEGKFTLETAGQPGAVPGSHRVTITKQKTSGGVTTGADGLEAGPATTPPKTEWLVPERYSRPETSDLTANVAAGAAPFTYDLKSQ